MIEVSEHHQIAVATRAWFDAARVQWARDFPDRPCPIPTYDELDQKGRSFFTIVMRRTIRAADPDNVAAVMARYEEEGRVL